MKKFISIWLISIFILIGCEQSNSEKSNSIKEAILTNREVAILDTVADKSFAFDYRISGYKEVAIWLEKYESGELVDDKVAWMSGGIDEKGTILFTTTNQADNEPSSSYYIGILSDSGTVSGSGSEDFPDGIPNMMSTWGSLSEKTITDSEIVLAAICYSDNEHGMSGLTTSFFEDPASHMSDLKEYDVAYLLKAEFKK
ncbi:hypothetical protein [Paucisalibacillus globulus]|uniref:hypothetical protein n=1 Tax=Paucisalibacillus globulus TaxID=351095 RepID=UPI000BB7A049|nr:hypothetical protein [Paucisalibacillus globulus]